MLSTALYFLSHGNVPEVLEDRGEERRWDSRLPLLPESLPQLGLQGGKALLGCRSLERGTGAGSRVPGARKAGPLVWVRARVLVRCCSRVMERR